MEERMENAEVMDEFALALLDDDETADQREADQPAASDEGKEQAPEVEAQEPPAEKENPGEGEGEQQPQEPQNEQPQQEETFELTHLATVHTVKREEMIALAQKGMDYDRMKEHRDRLSAENQELRKFQDENSEALEFLAQAAKSNGVSVEEYLDGARIGILMKQGLTKDAAVERIARERAEKKLAALQKREEAAKETDEATKRKNEDIQRFMQLHPEVKAAEIPKEVWDRVNKGESLVSAYEAEGNKKALAEAKAEAERLKRELEAEKKNNENRQKSLGSQATAGAAQSGKDPFLEAFMSDD